jgi:LPPG:FO 2-phospho-L-lactate transferase
MLSGLAAVLGQAALTAVVNTGDDTVLHGLYVSPDLDTVTYTLAGASNPATGWGLAGETWAVMEALAPFEGAAAGERLALTWFGLGDKDLATHLYRTGRLAAGVPLSVVTGEICRRFGVQARLLPMTDDRLETRVTVELGPAVPGFGGVGRGAEGAGRGAEGQGRAAEGAGRLREVGFQEYFVGLRHDVPVRAVRFAGAESAAAAPGVIEAIEQADLLVVCPSNPVVSIGPVLAVQGIADALRSRRESTVAVSPIVAGRALKGPADRMLRDLGHEASAAGVAALWAPIAATLVVDEADADLAPRVAAAGMHCVVAPTVMSGPAEAARLAEVVLHAGAGQ